MGNASSRRGRDAQHHGRGGCSSSRAQRRGGHLDPCNQLENVYARQIAENEQVKEQIRKAFKSVRILVVGRSGSGKSTLIRLLVGDKGPRTIARGHAGVQDITKEWHHPNPELPLIIHDSNGIDVAGKERIADIKKFLDARLAKDVKLAERVHAVWYVFSAIDNRALEDVGLLELLSSYGTKELPLLLIMTHTDWVKDNELDVDLGRLLEKIRDVERRKKVSEMMVRVGNKVKLHGDTGEILKQESILDVPGLRMVFKQTKLLMHKELWITWAACQAVHMVAKLEASANLIVCYHWRQVCASSTLAALPGANPIHLAAMFGSVTHGLAKIWNVQQEFEEAITKQFLVEERWHAVTSSLTKNTLAALALASALMLTIFTGGIGAPTIVVAAGGAALSEARSTPRLLMSYALMVLGTILYVKTHHQTTVDDGKATMEDYLKLCEEFMLSKYAEELSSFSDGYRSVWETFFRQKRQEGRLCSQIVHFFKKITFQRPNSLSSCMKNDLFDQSLTEPAADGDADIIDVIYNDVEEEEEEETIDKLFY